MTTFTDAKSSPQKSEVKNASLAMKSRQQVINEVNKRRTILQDNSWIKKQPEEQTVDENYGRVVLNQYKSQDSLHRNADEKDEKDEQKSLLSRYRSDTTLNRLSEKKNADKANKVPVLDCRPNNSKELIVPGSSTDNATSPVKKKRQSWMPPPVPSQKPTTDNMEHHKRQSCPPPNAATAVIINHNKPVASTSDKPGGPKMQVCPAKLSESDVDRSTTTEGPGRCQDLDNHIQVSATGEKNKNGNLDDLIKVKRTSNEYNKGNQDLDTLIQVTATGGNCEKGSLDNLIKVKSASNGYDKGTFDDLIHVNPTANGYNKGGRDLADFLDVNNTAPQNKRSQELDDLIVVKASAADQNGKGTSEQDCESVSAPDKQSDRTHSYQVTRGSSYNASSSFSHPKDIIVCTRTYQNSSKFPHDAYEDNIQGRSIKTIYSTADRAVIEKEMCTYCRKPLGSDTKMVLDALQICCHATCFQCEICKGPLENLKAGDSIWIYKNTVHCEPCYSKVKASWIY